MDGWMDGWILAFGKASIMLRHTPEFHHLFSNVMVILCVLSCAERLVSCSRRSAHTARANA